MPVLYSMLYGMSIEAIDAGAEGVVSYFRPSGGLDRGTRIQDADGCGQKVPCARSHVARSVTQYSEKVLRSVRSLVT